MAPMRPHSRPDIKQESPCYSPTYPYTGDVETPSYSPTVPIPMDQDSPCYSPSSYTKRAQHGDEDDDDPSDTEVVCLTDSPVAKGAPRKGDDPKGRSERAKRFLESNYSGDMVQVLKKQAATWTFLARSPQLSQRRLLVDRVFLWTKKLGLNQMTAFRATRFMDGFMDSHKILDGHLNIIVLTSIWVAAKFEESHKVLPKVKELEKLVDKEYKKEEFLSVELMILKHFQFGLMAIPVAADLVHALLPITTDPCDVRCGTRKGMETRREKFADYFLDLSQRETRLVPLNVCIVAGGVLHCVRRALEAYPIWPASLKNALELTEADVQTCAQLMWDKYKSSKASSKPAEKMDASTSDGGRKRKASRPPDEGYESPEVVEID